MDKSCATVNVPVEPTTEMVEAGVYAQEPNQANSGGSNNSNRLRRRAIRVYRAMLAAYEKQSNIVRLEA